MVWLSAVLDVNENKLNNTVILSSNSNTGKFALSFSEEISITSIKIINVLGKTIYSKTNIPRATFEIDQNYMAGIYFVKVSSLTSEATLKMIID